MATPDDLRIDLGQKDPSDAKWEYHPVGEELVGDSWQFAHQGGVSGPNFGEQLWDTNQRIADLEVRLWFAGCFIVGVLAGVVVSLL